MANFLENHLRRMGVLEENVLGSIMHIPRERFIPSRFSNYAYDNTPIPLGYSRISFQPHLIAMMAEAAQLQSTDRVLEVGTGCGYGAAVLSRLSNNVYSLECVEELFEDSFDRLRELGFHNVTVHHHGDLHEGCSQYAPYDAIILDVATCSIPSSYLEQLAVNGRLIVPLVDENAHKGDLIRITRTGPNCYEEELIQCLFDHQHMFINNDTDDAYW